MRIAATAACLFFAAAFAHSEPPAQGKAGSPEARVIRIEPREDRTGRWIETETEFVALLPLPLQAVAAVLEDYPSYPRYVPHLARTAVSRPGNAGTRITQRYEIAILGYRYRSEYSLDIEIDASAVPARWEQKWHLARTDGSIGASDGSWVLESVGTADAPATRATHRNRGLVRQSFPLQARVMRSVAERELGGAIAAVCAEARNRASLAVAAAQAQYP